MCLCRVFVDEQAKREIKEGILVASVQLFSNNKLAITFTFSGCTNKRTNSGTCQSLRGGSTTTPVHILQMSCVEKMVTIVARHQLV
jgi:hypothetical protein